MIEGLSIADLSLTSMRIELISGEWNETSQNGSVSIQEFLGTALVTMDGIELDGNVSRLVKG